MEESYIDVNKNSWNNRVQSHLNSEFYNVQEFLQGKSSLNKIEVDLLGNVQDKSILHLQCHFGQDSISLARMGANVTGVDFSEKAIEAAKELAVQAKSTAEFICSDIYKLPEHLNRQFDIVFTSYGTIGWLPDLNKWAAIVARYLKPGGKFVFVEFHPVVWMFDNDFENIHCNYFKSSPIIETELGTYADKKSEASHKSITWNHSLGDVMSSLLDEKLRLESFQEFDYSPYDCFNKTEEFSPGKFRIKHLENKIPMVYALVARKEV